MCLIVSATYEAARTRLNQTRFDASKTERCSRASLARGMVKERGTERGERASEVPIYF